ncbi:hypothetical protein KUTeg_010895, partial [Tegillarca granosa]
CEVCKAVSSSVTTKTALITTATAPSKPVDIRIPLALYPDLYTVEIQPNMYEGEPEHFTFNGSVRIRMECRQNTRNITLHIKKLNITGRIMVTQEGRGSINYASIEEDKQRQFLIVHFNEDLTKGNFYTIQMSFIGPLKNDLVGLYLSSYQRGNKTIYLATTQFQATDARKTFPCFDEPAIKAKFDLTLVRQSHMVSLSNMPNISSENRGNGWIADTFNTTPPIAWSRPEAVDQTRYALGVGVELLTYFEDYFNISFPLPKQDMIAIPDFSAGAMENWGLIAYRETAMLYDPVDSSSADKQRVAAVVSHELAHQWYGNLVTPSWWDDLWLNEGFASFVEYMGVAHVHQDWKMFDQFIVEALQNVFNFDGLVTSHPVYVPVSHPDQIIEIFDRISYAKGASIIRMMRFFLGEETFKRGLTRYLNELKYGAAFHDDLWFALGNQSKIENKARYDVKEIMDTWTLQMNYPVVIITKDSATRIRIQQKRYLRDPEAVDPGTYISPFQYKWEIPFTYTTSVAPNFNQSDANIVWLNRHTESLPIDTPNLSGSNTWVIGNVKQYGYYRVNYDDRNWNALINQLKINHTVIHDINRAQIINDAWNLAKSGDLKMETALGTVEYLKKEREYIVWEAASHELSYVNLMLERTPLYGKFSRYMVEMVSETFNETGLDNTGAQHLESIDASLRYTVYCTGIKYGGVEEWDFAFNQYKTSTVASEKSRLMSALACSKESWILTRYLRYALTPDQIRKQDALLVLRYISSNSVGRSLTWDFIRANWDDIFNEYGSGSLSFARLIADITESFNTNSDDSQLEDFIERHPNLGSGTRAFQQAVEKTKSNIKWMEKNYPILENWLKDY